MYLRLSAYHKSAVRPVVSECTTVQPADFLYAQTLYETSVKSL